MGILLFLRFYYVNGVKQGGVLSAMLFTVYIDKLMLHILPFVMLTT